jgi:hypothetical protein
LINTYQAEHAAGNTTNLAQPIKKGPLALAYRPAATGRKNLSALVPHRFTRIPPTYLGILMKSVIAAKAVLFPEAEEKRFLPREVLENAFVLASHLGAQIAVNMEGEQHPKIRAFSFVGDACRCISKNQRIVVFRLIQ